MTDLWATWAYAWPLVAPGGVGLGMALYGSMRGLPDVARDGVRSLGVGLALFVAFGLFFEGVIGLSGDPFLVGSDVLPIVLIGLGAVILVLGLLREPPDLVMRCVRATLCAGGRPARLARSVAWTNVTRVSDRR